MKRFARRILAPALAVLLLGPFAGGLRAQQHEPDPGDTTNLTREERIKLHEERVRKIIEQRRQERLEQEKRRKELEQQQQAEEEPVTPETPPEDAGVPPDGEEPGLAAPHPPTEPTEYATTTLGNVILYNALINKDTGESELDAVIRSGDRFLSEVRLQNDNSVNLDRIQIALHYDKRFIKPVRVFDSGIHSFLEGEPVFQRVDRDGLLVYEAKLNRPRPIKDTALLRVIWEALRPTEFAGIGFRFADEGPGGDTGNAGINTAVFSGERNILGNDDDPIDGVLGSSLLILKPFDPVSTEGEILQGKKEELKALYLGSVGANARAGISLVPPAEVPAAGTDFDVEVALNNPQGAIIDSLRFFISFDPEFLEVVDEDDGNWIKRGVNVHDGPYRADFPFDYHKRNEADNVRGQINYSMALGRELALPNGTFATIRFHAKKPTGRTPIELISTRQGAGALTAVQSFGYDLLSSDEEFTQPRIDLAILPESAARTELAAKPDEAEKQADSVDDSKLSPQVRIARLMYGDGTKPAQPDAD